MTADETRAAKFAQSQLDAYNARDVDAFARCYTEDVRVFRDAFGATPDMVGRSALRESYALFFREEPGVRCTLIGRQMIGNWAIDNEFVDGFRDGKTVRVTAIYGVDERGIHTVRFLRGTET